MVYIYIERLNVKILFYRCFNLRHSLISKLICMNVCELLIICIQSPSACGEGGICIPDSE